MIATIDPRAGRAFVARRAAVAAPHQLAATAGLGLLLRGGSAVDAMVATNAVLGVVYPHMTGPGGDAFWLVHDAVLGRQHVLNATGRSASAATLDRYSLRAGGIPVRGPGAVLTVPGAVDGWVEAHRRFGRLPLSDCLAPAIAYAEDGFPVAPGLARWSAASRDVLAAWPATASAFLKDDGSPYRVGETLRLPALAETLAAVAEGGRAPFYEGPIARRIAAFLAAHGGVLTPDDLAAHRSDWVDPVRGGYRGWTVLTTPPNSQGFATLEILGILEHFDVAGLAAEPARYVDLVVRATRASFTDRDRYLTDPAFSPVPLDQLLGAEHLAELSRSLGRSVAIPPSRSPGMAGDTTFSCAVDCEGNVAAVIQSLYFEWGSGVVAGDTGILLQNRGTSFSLDPSHPNRLEPGKRTFHTLTATLMLDKEGDPGLVLGTMGGDGQPQTQAAVVTRMIDHDMPVQAAIDAPRWLHGRTWGEEHSGLRLERSFGEAIVGELAVLGHQQVGLVEEFSDLMGHAQAIRIFPERLEAASDPRADGVALGY